MSSIPSNVTSAIQAKYFSDPVINTIQDLVPNIERGISGYSPDTSAWVRNAAFLVVVATAVGLSILCAALIYFVFRSSGICSRQPYQPTEQQQEQEDADAYAAVQLPMDASMEQGKTMQPYEQYNGVDIDHGHNTNRSTDSRSSYWSASSSGIRITMWVSFFLCLSCVAFAACTIAFAADISTHANNIRDAVNKLFVNANTYLSNVESNYPRVNDAVATVQRFLAKYAYINDDIDYWVNIFNIGVIIATACLVSCTFITFLLLFIAFPLMRSKSAKLMKWANAFFLTSASIALFTTVLLWILFGCFLGLMKASSDLCNYTDSLQGDLTTAFNSQTVANVAAACLTGSNALQALGVDDTSAISNRLSSCSNVGDNYYQFKSTLCQRSAIVKDLAFNTLFSFLTAVLMTPVSFLLYEVQRRLIKPVKKSLPMYHQVDTGHTSIYKSTVATAPSTPVKEANTPVSLHYGKVDADEYPTAIPASAVIVQPYYYGST